MQGIGDACSLARDYYVAVQEDVAEGWTLGNTLSYISFGMIAPAKGAKTAAPKVDDLKEGFAIL